MHNCTENPIDVVVVGEEPSLRENLLAGLSSHGYRVRGVADGSALDATLARKRAQVILLDARPPGENGLELAARLGGDPSLGVILLTEPGLTDYRIRGLNSGADYCFAKPVNTAELAASINNLSKRLASPVRRSWDFNPEESSLTTPKGIRIILSAMECILMELVFPKAGLVVSRDQILTALGHSDDASSISCLQVLISRLRSKVLRADPGSRLPLRACNNLGYVFLVQDRK